MAFWATIEWVDGRGSHVVRSADAACTDWPARRDPRDAAAPAPRALRPPRYDLAGARPERAGRVA